MENQNRVALDGGVVVGDDGSAYAEIAVVMAAAEAIRREMPLHVVRAWSLTTAVTPPGVPFGIVPSMNEYHEATAAVEHQRVHELLPDAPPPVFQVHVLHAPAAEALIEASKHADLLVLGDRGLGGFERLLLGSVAEQCLRHAHCSVLLARRRSATPSRHGSDRS